MEVGDPMTRGVANPPVLRRARGIPLCVTLGELVEAVASVTVDRTEQAAVVDHILRTIGMVRAPRADAKTEKPT